ncbi:hypothetical protein ACSSWA_11320 [Melioribacter sp. Ez-97]|uniref:hypothetical protein n=1 Tax=Melioribacter sp. Ez-97 TaxID=3423434 RepID=UPI003EDA5D31
MINKIFQALYWRVERRLHSSFLKKKLKYGKLNNIRLHFGCGSNPLIGYINVDFQLSKGVDLIEDLNCPKIFSNNCAREIFSNAFFEHLYRKNRIEHLRRCKDILKPGGIICYLGIPYFPEVAKLYVEGEFTLYQVYRYTHGDPETD